MFSTAVLMLKGNYISQASQENMDGDGKNMSSKMQSFLNKIPPGMHCRLDACIESEKEFCDIAVKLTDWKPKYDILGLTFVELLDIIDKKRPPKLQR